MIPYANKDISNERVPHMNPESTLAYLLCTRHFIPFHLSFTLYHDFNFSLVLYIKCLYLTDELVLQIFL